MNLKIQLYFQSEKKYHHQLCYLMLLAGLFHPSYMFYFWISKFYVIFSLQILSKFFLFRIQKNFVKILIFFRCILLPFSLKCQHGLLFFVFLEEWDETHGVCDELSDERLEELQWEFNDFQRRNGLQRLEFSKLHHLLLWINWLGIGLLLVE